MRTELNSKIEDSYILCLCEGAAEKAIMDILIDVDKLIFKREDLLENVCFKVRKAKNVEQNFLQRDYSKEVNILRILDSRKENFKLGGSYTDRFSVYNFYTTPEIEILIIICEGDYEVYCNSKNLKPSEFCKIRYKYKDVKSEKFIKDYFNCHDKLIRCLKDYESKSANKKEYSIFHLLK